MLFARDCLYWLQALREHSANARLTREQLAALQRRKFRRLAAYVYEKSPYYRDLMRRLKLDPKTCRPEDFPILTKHDFNEHFDEIVTDRRITHRSVIEFVRRGPGSPARFLNRYHVVHSTGTSGTMVYLAFSEKDWIQGSSLIRRVPSPLRLRKRVASVLAAERNLVARELTAGGDQFPANLFYHCRILDVAWSLDRIVEELNQFQPHYLTSYVGAMLMLAAAQRKGALHIRPQEVSTGGELLTAHDRELIEQAFGVRMRNTYACSEALYLALGMDAGDGLYLQEDETVFELHGDHTCITPLFNFTTPLIRYRMNDILVPEEHTSGALPFRRVRELIGREEHNLVFHNPRGEPCVLYWPEVEIFHVDGVDRGQFAQHDEASLSLRIRYVAGVQDDVKRQIGERLENRLGALLEQKGMSFVHCQVVEAPDLAPDVATGKFPRVVRSNAAGTAVRETVS